MKKTTKIIIGIIVLVALGFILNPFYWLMQSQTRPQPELSKEEIVLFEKLKSTYHNCKLERFYNNYTSKGYDTLYEKRYNKVPFEYSLSLERIDKYDLNDNHNDDLNNDLSNDLNDDLVFEIGLNVKNNILKRNKFLQKISIYVDHKPYEYLYDYKKDTLVLQP